MLRVLRAVDAAFALPGAAPVSPFSIELEPGERGSLFLPSRASASIAARMAAGIVKPTSGTLFIADFDPKLQPVQAKRVVGFVPVGGAFGDVPREPLLAGDRSEVIDFHAALYEVDPATARRRAHAVLSLFETATDEALALALALMRPIALLVLDQPSTFLAGMAPSLSGGRIAVLTTSTAPLAQPEPQPSMAGTAR